MAGPHASTHHALKKVGPLASLAIAIGTAILGYLIVRSLIHDASAAPPAAHAPPWWGLGTLPFVCILGAIAVLPLIPRTQHWWEKNRNRLIVSLMCAAMTVTYYLLSEGPSAVEHVLDHAVIDDYVPFIVLLFSLYVISGGISLRGDLKAHPITNTAFLAVGALIASVVGTTGASMLLIRPLLQTNRERKHVVHTVVFFIFLVSNIGGSLLPIGDPPLFLGYLRGVPFLWTAILWKEWAFCCVILLIVYFIWDSRAYKTEAKRDIKRDESQLEPLRIRGAINFVWLIWVVLAVALVVPGKPFPGFGDGGVHSFPFLRELLLLLCVGLSLLTTPPGVHKANRFNYHAILEVAALFIGIFITMQVPIAALNVMGGELGLTQPWHYFWTTGSLSSVLDNAPTYVVFFETANALTHSPGEGILNLVSGHFIREDLLIAISLGAVFMGANTYIGNGPNFMVKSIAEQSGVQMPSFFGYVFRYSLPILIPLFIVVTILFLR